MNLQQLEKLCVEIRAHSRVPNPTIDFWLPNDVEAHFYDQEDLI